MTKPCFLKFTSITNYYLEAGLQELKTDRDWGIETREALTRTIVDLLIFDRKRLLCQTSPFHTLRLVGEYPITTTTLEDSTIINGRCDLVRHPRKKDLAFGLVAIEIKKRYGLGAGVSFLLGYLAAACGEVHGDPPGVCEA